MCCILWVVYVRGGEGGGERTIPTVRNLRRKSRTVRVFLVETRRTQLLRRTFMKPRMQPGVPKWAVCWSGQFRTKFKNRAIYTVARNGGNFMRDPEAVHALCKWATLHLLSAYRDKTQPDKGQYIWVHMQLDLRTQNFLPTDMTISLLVRVDIAPISWAH